MIIALIIIALLIVGVLSIGFGLFVFALERPDRRDSMDGQ